jgi:hypothetical protein
MITLREENERLMREGEEASKHSAEAKTIVANFETQV